MQRQHTNTRSIQILPCRCHHLSFQPSELTLEWREQTIVPQYNSAGVKKLAFVWGPDVEVPPDYDYADPAEHFVEQAKL